MIKRSKLNRRIQPQLRNQLMPTDSVIIVYYDNRFALLSPMQYTEMLVTLSGEAGKKILKKIRHARRSDTSCGAIPGGGLGPGVRQHVRG